MSTVQILASRQKSHGNFLNTAAKAQAIKSAVFEGGGGCSFLNAVQKESLEMIATKIARICAGDPFEKDHWADIAGYATLVSQTLPEKTDA